MKNVVIMWLKRWNTHSETSCTPGGYTSTLTGVYECIYSKLTSTHALLCKAAVFVCLHIIVLCFSSSSLNFSSWVSYDTFFECYNTGMMDSQCERYPTVEAGCILFVGFRILRLNLGCLLPNLLSTYSVRNRHSSKLEHCTSTSTYYASST